VAPVSASPCGLPETHKWVPQPRVKFAPGADPLTRVHAGQHRRAGTCWRVMPAAVRLSAVAAFSSGLDSEED
jgi:hypothetical protein